MIERTGDTYADETYAAGLRCLERHEEHKALLYFVASARQEGDDRGHKMLEQYFAEEAERKVNELRAAATAGNAEAQYTLSYLFEHGLGVKKGPLQHSLWLQRAADRGLAEAQFQIGKGYLYMNNEEASRWFKWAAEQGHMEAQNELAISYATGTGMPEDAAEAIKWHTLAAEQGQTESCRMLGLMYMEGEGVEKDPVKAAYWFRRTQELRGAIEDDLLEWAATVENNTPPGE